MLKLMVFVCYCRYNTIDLQHMEDHYQFCWGELWWIRQMYRKK